MFKVANIVGTRPQFVKAAVASEALAVRSEVLEIVVHAGQHYDYTLSGVFFEELGIPKPRRLLDIGTCHTHGSQMSRMLEGLEAVFLEEGPDCVLVYGDSNTTLAGALAAAKLRIPVAHIEAGMRSYNKEMPEEINRVTTDHISDLLFAPTPSAAENLRREGIPEGRIFVVGDVMYDVAIRFGERAATRRILERLGLAPKSYILATVHRAENTDIPCRLAAIVEALCTTVTETGFPVVWPLHPRTRKALEGFGVLGLASERLCLIDPVGYLDMLVLEKKARLIVTDSGGVQKEAFFHHVPCVVVRSVTEWVELVEMGWSVLVPPVSAEEIYEKIVSTLSFKGQKNGCVFGNGRTAERIVEHLIAFLKMREHSGSMVRLQEPKNQQLFGMHCAACGWTFSCCPWCGGALQSVSNQG
ncbi:UDP-N-acetylglucosamine 2-epimerase (non-hydrolyzing) [Moorellaceae bacterium AZ2]